MATPAPPTRAPKGDLARWAFEALNTRDIVALRQLWNDATVERFPQRTCHGRDVIARYFEQTFAALPDVHLKVLCISEQGDDVFVHWQLTGTHTGVALDGIEGTGRAIALDDIDHFVMRDGNVVSNFVVFDQMQFARQVGRLPPDGTAPIGLSNAPSRRCRGC
jgi:predicted ester cyclase